MNDNIIGAFAEDFIQINVSACNEMSFEESAGIADQES